MIWTPFIDMNPLHRHSNRSAGHLLCSLVWLPLLTASPIMAQTSDLQASPAANETAPSAGPVSGLRPLRMVSSADIEPYVEFVKSRTSIASRKADPFGQIQDTTQKVEVKKPTMTNRRPTRMKATTFDEIVGRIQVTTVMPAEQRFLIGGRSFRLGDEFPMTFRGRNHRVKVVGVSAREIEFKKLESGEIASIKLKMLPAGMQAGSDGIMTPGLLSNDKNAPLQVDGAPGLPDR